MTERMKQCLVLAAMGLILMAAGAWLLLPSIGWRGFAGLVLVTWGNNTSNVKL